MSYVLLNTALGMLEVSCGSMWFIHVLCIVDYSSRYVGGVLWSHVIYTCPMYCWLQLSVCWRYLVGPCDLYMSYVLLITALGMLEVSCGSMWCIHVLCIVDYSSRYVGGVVWSHDCDLYMSYVLLITALGMLEVSCGSTWLTHVLCIVDYSSRYVGGVVWSHDCDLYMSYVLLITALGMLKVSCGSMWLTHVLCIVDYSSRYVGGIVWVHVIYTCPMYCWLQLSVCWRCRVGPCDWHMSYVLLITALGMLEVSCGSMWFIHVLCIFPYSSRYVGGIVWVHVIYTCPMYFPLQLSVCWRCRVGPCDWHMSYVLLITALGMLEVSCGFMWFIHVLCIFPYSSRYVGGIVWVHVINTCLMYCWLHL